MVQLVPVNGGCRDVSTHLATVDVVYQAKVPRHGLAPYEDNANEEPDCDMVNIPLSLTIEYHCCLAHAKTVGQK